MDTRETQADFGIGDRFKEFLTDNTGWLQTGPAWLNRDPDQSAYIANSLSAYIDSIPADPPTLPHPTWQVTKAAIEDKPSGTKHDQGKPPMALLDHHALTEIAKVLGFGARKYDDHNWRKGFPFSRLVSAAMRHISAWNSGEDNDPESGLSHLAHAGCCLMFLLSLHNDKPELDDRYKPIKIS